MNAAPPAQGSPPAGAHANDAQIAVFRRRAQQSRYQALGFLAIIVGALLGGGFTATYASLITEKDFAHVTAGNEKNEKIKRRIDSIQLELADISGSLKQFEIQKLKELESTHEKRTAVERELIEGVVKIAKENSEAHKETSEAYIDVHKTSTKEELASAELIPFMGRGNIPRFEICVGLYAIDGAHHANMLAVAKEFGVRLGPKIAEQNKLRRAQLTFLAPGPAETTLLERRESLQKEILTLAELRKGVEKKLIEEKLDGVAEEAKPSIPSPSVVDWGRLVQTNVTRFGVLVIVIFLAKILLPQYRYSVRLAAFYDAVGDAMALGHCLPPTKESIEALFPRVDFSELPATPIEQAIELLKAFKDSTPMGPK